MKPKYKKKNTRRTLNYMKKFENEKKSQNHTTKKSIIEENRG